MQTDKTDKKFFYKDLSYKVVGCIYNVRNAYGNGQKELVYQNALAEKLREAKIPCDREVNVKIKSIDTGKKLGNYRLDFVIDNKIILEVKALTYTPEKIERQLYSYLKSTPYKIGYLVNFGSTRLYLKRIILTNDRKRRHEISG